MSNNDYNHQTRKTVFSEANTPLRIAISGQSGCGNTTIGRLLAEKLQLNFINYTFRNLAEERNLSFEEICRKAQTDEQFDREIDNKQIELAQAQACVLSSRLAIWMLEEASLKVYLYASVPVRIARISQREGGDIDSILSFTETRDANDRERYKRLYNLDTSSYNFAHICINTEFYDPEQIVNIIINSLHR